MIGFDRDPDASAKGPSLVPDARLTLINERFSQMDRVLAERGLLPVDGIALDIGVSSMQLDQAERGFSFSNDGPLDMRMSQSGESAADVLNHADEAEIARVLKEYGEEPRARAVARAIVAARPLTRTVGEETNRQRRACSSDSTTNVLTLTRAPVASNAGRTTEIAFSMFLSVPTQRVQRVRSSASSSTSITGDVAFSSRRQV